MRDFKLNDVVISVFIVLVTIIYFLDKYFIPEKLETVNVFGIEIGSFGFLDIRHLVYYSKMKILILFFTITWYLTCRHWWKSAILVIITIELLKLVTALNDNSEVMDEIDYLVSLPITIPIILLLFLVSKKINNYNMAKKLRSNLDTDIDNIFFELHQIDKIHLDLLKDEFIKVKKERNTKSYLKELILIRDKFYSKI